MDKGADGTGCQAEADCLSGFCVDGVCCDAACDGDCQACDVEASAGVCTPVADNTDISDDCGKCGVCDGAGSCKPAAAGEDPKDECEGVAADTCSWDGNCDGAYDCGYWDATTECGEPECVDETLYAADLCDGAGACVEDEGVSCCPYVCGTGACLAACTGDEDCCAGATCVADACVVD